MVILLLQSILRSTIQKVEEQQLGPGDIKKENQEKISTLDHWKGKKKKKLLWYRTCIGPVTSSGTFQWLNGRDGGKQKQI